MSGCQESCRELEKVVGGVKEKELVADPYSAVVIPVAWYGRLEAGAKLFEMPLPPDYFSG
jgi:hypothetical protein